jgi:hypothetical protein
MATLRTGDDFAGTRVSFDLDRHAAIRTESLHDTPLGGWFRPSIAP